MQLFSENIRRQNKKIGFVPTMGYLHKGHLSLVDIATENSDEVIVSIFVNPAQFGPNEDFTKYPRDEKRDFELLEGKNVAAVFYPDASEIYSSDFQTYVNVEKITLEQEGEFRPSHFKGVTTIVSVLFNCVKPNVAVFGQKDAQQASIILRMIEDLKYNIRMIVAPIIREDDGLALSSRNVYLSEEERKDALVLRRSLDASLKMIIAGERSTGKIIKTMKEFYYSVESARLQYIRIVDAQTFEEISLLQENRKYYILIACFVGKTRLIDNELISL